MWQQTHSQCAASAHPATAACSHLVAQPHTTNSSRHCFQRPVCFLPAACPSLPPPPLLLCFPDTSSIPQIIKVSSCVQASVVGTGTGTGISFATSQAGTVKVAAESCGDALGGAIGSICKGNDPMAAVFGAAQTCAAAVSATYSKARTNAMVFDPVKPPNDTAADTTGYLQACASACANAQGTAEALAQASACGVQTATADCVAANNIIQSQGFSRAFSSGIYNAWASACARSRGTASATSQQIAGALVVSFSRSFGALVTDICASCKACKCRGRPAFPGTAGSYQSVTPLLAAGKLGLATAMAEATSSFCQGKTSSAKVAARSMLATYSELLGGALGQLKGSVEATGGGWSCSGTSVRMDLQVRPAGWRGEWGV